MDYLIGQCCHKGNTETAVTGEVFREKSFFKILNVYINGNNLREREREKTDDAGD